MFLSRKSLTTLILILLGAAIAGCAEERPAVDRVQTFALKKAFFVGEDIQDPADNPEFWTQATLVDVGYGAAVMGLFTSTYAQPMARLRWQITEDMLIGRLAYERVEGSDGKGLGEKTLDGVIVAAFNIEKHFDIANAYNPTTGEQLNIVEENDSDRPWYEREYIRVDFSENLNVDSYDFDTLSLVGIYGGVEYESLKYYVDDPTHEDAPYFDSDSGYFDITTKAFAKPAVVDLSHLGWGIDSFPACYLGNDFFGGSYPSGSCSPVELTLRHSFRRVVDTDYEPIDWDGYRFQAYGGFYLERLGFARNYGMSDAKWRRFLTRYQIWERSHYYDDPENMTGPVECYTPETTLYGADPHRDENGDGTEDECAAVGNGSRCDIHRQMCTLPYQDRTPITIAWYYTNGNNPDFYEATDLATHEWDVALRTAVRAAQYAECKEVGGDDCLTRFPMYFGQQGDNEDAVSLALEVDDCRSGKAYADKNKDEEKCQALADTLGKERGYASGVISIAKMKEMIVLCHSPVEYDDHPECGANRIPKGMTWDDCEETLDQLEADVPEDQLDTYMACKNVIQVRRGDLRYHQVNVVDEPQTPSPWGIYTDSEDPLTGETVAASINIWSHITDLWSQKVIDILRYIKGELSVQEVTDGEYVDEWAKAAESLASGGVLPKLTRKQVNRMVNDFTQGVALDTLPDHKAIEAALPEVVQATRNLKQELTGVAASVDVGATTAPLYAARMNSAAGSEVEALLMNRQMQQLNGVDGLPLTESLMNMVSPLRGGNPTVQRQLLQMRENALAKRGACVLREADAPLDLVGLAGILEVKFGKFNPADAPEVQQERSERMRKYLANRAHMSVIIHEMGHSVGLRHNFVSSSDAWNFRPQYWQLRTKNGMVKSKCEDLSADGENCVGPRYFDPVTDEERSSLIRMFMASSVMEYPGETTQDFLGLGAYDFAAARMLYGDVVAVYADPSFKVGTDRGNTAMAKMDNFGGILGIQHRYQGNDIHYSELHNHLDMIQDCKAVDPKAFRPARHNDEERGFWDPVLDGMIVFANGGYSRCKQQKVDYVSWDDMRNPADSEFEGYMRGSHAVDDEGRIRVPYGFATDRWADLGNLSVYRHDNGADPYEIFDFLITQQEVMHIFDNYRRGRQDFSVRSASSRTLRRYNEKIRDGAKGLGLLKNIYRDFALEMGYDFDGLWPDIAPLFFKENILASGLVFDHFVRNAVRPQPGPHFRVDGDPVLRSSEDTVAQAGATAVLIPNGATGKFGNIASGGRLVENRLASDQGEFDAEQTINAGSYYDKINTAMLFTESVDNFISDSRQDFVDARYRAVSLADLFPDGYRRFLSNSLTGDDFLKGPHLAASGNGTPKVDPKGFPDLPIGWVSWWGEAPKVCFPSEGTTICGSFGVDSAPFDANYPNNTTVLDPQIGWEVQKFLIAWTLLYLPENQKQEWIDMLRIWELGKDADPGFENRIEFHYPHGKTYIAKSYGTETLFGRKVEKGIAGRVLQYANQLMNEAYVTVPGPDRDGDGEPEWYLPVFNPETGQPLVRWDKSIAGIKDGFVYNGGVEGCNPEDNSECTCSSNRSCIALKDYVEVPFFLRQTLDAYGLVSPHPKGVYD